MHSTTAPLQKIRKEIAILEEAVAEDDRLAAIGRIKKLQVSGKVARVSAAMWRGAACASGNLFSCDLGHDTYGHIVMYDTSHSLTSAL